MSCLMMSIVNMRMIITIVMSKSELKVPVKLRQKYFVEHVLKNIAIGTMITYLVLILVINVIFQKNVA